MNLNVLEKYVSDGLLSVRKHPNENLFIYNYTPTVQYSRAWDEITLNARGLILDEYGNIVARGFKKFFNLSEHQSDEIPIEPFEVYQKMDGSLGILVWVGDTPHIATRGSFTSEQALHATVILHKKYSHIFERLDKSKTYLFEIIYPEGRIVCDYGDMDDIVLLAVLDTKTGQDCPLEDIGFPIVKLYDGIKNLTELHGMQNDIDEGFVVKFQSGFRVKVKFEEYVRLHRIVTGVSNITVWEYMRDGKSFDELLDRVPDEWYKWLKETVGDLKNNYDTIYNEAKSVFKEFPTRKETALYFKEQKYPSVLFSMLDGKRPDAVIWRMLRPKFSKPFKTDKE